VAQRRRGPRPCRASDDQLLRVVEGVIRRVALAVAARFPSREPVPFVVAGGTGSGVKGEVAAESLSTASSDYGPTTLLDVDRHGKTGA
jgi:hypothetical protein